MHGLSPFQLFETDKHAFIHCECAICLCAMFYPENVNENDKMVSCLRLQCMHTFHTKCINQLLQNKCPQCRAPIQHKSNLDRSLELTIRKDAFDHGNIDEALRHRFMNSGLQLEDYPYHRVVFKRWRDCKISNLGMGRL